MKLIPRLKLAGQLALIGLACCAPAIVRGQEAESVSALTLQPFSGENLAAISSPVVMASVFSEVQLPPTRNESISYSPDLGGSQDFRTISESIDSPEYLGLEEFAPAPETSTWVAGLLAAFLALPALHQRLRGRAWRPSAAGAR